MIIITIITLDDMESLTPSFLRMLAAEDVKTVLLMGCGGGFDFVHSALLLPFLRAHGKRVVILSHSFGSTAGIVNAEVVFSEPTLHRGTCEAKLVTGSSEQRADYAPELGLCSFLDETWVDDAPHSIYASNARLFCVPMLLRLLRQLVAAHNVDTVVAIDGGSDSLMTGDEYGLGDPIEDCVSVTAVAALSAAEGVHRKLLVSCGFGMDRFNNVSDADGLRAIAELTTVNGFLGSVSIEPSSESFTFYRAALEHINARATFRSVMSLGIVAAIEGKFGYTVPPSLQTRVQEGHLYLWPLTGMLFAFDPQKVVERSLLAPLLRPLECRDECDQALNSLRARLVSEARLRPIANLPTHEETLRRRSNVLLTDTEDLTAMVGPDFVPPTTAHAWTTPRRSDSKHSDGTKRCAIS